MKMRPSIQLKALAVAAGAALLCSGCAVGPDYRRPKLPESSGYAPTPLPETTASAPGAAGAAQHFDATLDVPAQWWTLFQSAQLNALIERALKANPTLESARAALRQAQESVYAQEGFFFPSVQASYSPSRVKISGNTGGNSPGIQGNGSVISTTANTPASQGGTAPFNAPVIYNWHSAQVTVGFVPDVFGANRRQVESLQAQADAQRFEFEAARITLASNVVAAAIQEASLRAQIGAAQKSIAANTKSVDLLRQQQAAGFASRLDVAALESALAQSEALLPPLQKQLEQTRDLIRALAGQPQDRDVEQVFELESLQLPRELPLSLPSRLVEQRPDVRAAEAQVHAASAQVGVALAARLPQFAINANAGGNAGQFSQMFWASGKFFSIAGSVSQALFDGGTLKHRQRAAQEALAQAEAQYRSTVLTAFQNVADALRAVHADADTLGAAARAEAAAKTTLDLSQRQQEVGHVNALVVLNAEQAYQQTLIASAQARASRLGDAAALFQALGGGWWNGTETSGR